MLKRYLLVLLAIYIPLQLWGLVALINTVGSDENLLENNLIIFLPMVISSVGFGLFIAGFVKENRKRFFSSLFIGTFVLFIGQTALLNYWASEQTKETKITAFFSVLAKSVIVNSAGMPNEQDDFNSPEDLRVELVYLPGWLTLIKGERAYKNLAINSSYAKSFFNTGNENKTVVVDDKKPSVQVKKPVAKKKEVAKTQAKQIDLTKDWEGYASYLKLAAMTKTQEKEAKDFIEGLYTPHFGKVYPIFGKTHEFALSCTGKAYEILAQLNKDIPSQYSLAQGFKKEEIRNNFFKLLRENGLAFPTNWNFTSEQKLVVDISNGFCRNRDKDMSLFENQYGKKVLNNNQPFTAAEYMQLVTGIENIDSFAKVEELNEDGNLLAEMSEQNNEEPELEIEQVSPAKVAVAPVKTQKPASVNLVSYANSNVGNSGDQWFKIAIMPAIGLSMGFAFLLLNSLMFISAGLQTIKLPVFVARLTVTIVFALLVWVSKPYSQGLMLANISLQKTTYESVSYFLTNLGLTPSLSMLSANQSKQMSLHHLKRAELALSKNLLATPVSRSSLFHVTMAEYYDDSAPTKNLLATMLRRYEILGAEKSRSKLNDRYEYIKKWNGVYQ